MAGRRPEVELRFKTPLEADVVATVVNEMCFAIGCDETGCSETLGWGSNSESSNDVNRRPRTGGGLAQRFSSALSCSVSPDDEDEAADDEKENRK